MLFSLNIEWMLPFDYNMEYIFVITDSMFNNIQIWKIPKTQGPIGLYIGNFQLDRVSKIQ